MAETEIHIGDATHSQTLSKFHAARAHALVICVNDPEITGKIIVAARRISPDLPILVRAHDEEQANDLRAHGASVAVPEVLESGLQLGEALLAELDVPSHTATELVSQLRNQAYARVG